ncbi:MAG TPA: ATPase, T2SS/T4P/T4SS family [Candidatus Bathyarchaeia archaeon]|nr:ATPase, T2SS/T4P/T4SS family [Candidatus Bathyarchaeia archaeon]
MSLPQDRRAWLPLGQMLVNEKVLTADQLYQALERQRKTRERLGQILIDMKLIDEDMLLKYLGAQFRKEPISRQELEALESDVVKLVPEEVARQYGVIAAQRSGRRLIVATADPLNVMALDDLRRATGLDVDFRIGPAGAIQDAIDRSYRRTTIGPAPGEGLDDALKMDLGLSVGPTVATPSESTVDIRQLQSQADDPPVVRVVNYVLGRAALDGASDIHVEPHDDRTRVRYRIDGLLFDLLEIPRQLHLAVVSRMKIISRLDIAERRLPQDGSFASRIHGQEFDFRVSTLPTIYGEKVVLRLLEKAAVVERYSIETLGFEKEQLELFLKGIRRPWGMVLMTGPTGSGKSTTLHTALKFIKSPRKNIITVEDPVEYRQPGIQQVQVKAEIGLDFARSLRSILRQDPDIIMLGEIRDQETAEIAVKAALTGHLVLSTLHTNDAISTLVRLINIGVEPFLVASAVNVVAAQRLVRRICKDCKEAYRPSADELALFAPDPGPEFLYRGRGCKSCRNVGYAGRMALYEVFAVGPDVRRMLIDGADGDKIQRYAIESGMITLRQCGFRQAARGLTTLEEVLTVATDAD